MGHNNKIFETIRSLSSDTRKALRSYIRKEHGTQKPIWKLWCFFENNSRTKEQIEAEFTFCRSELARQIFSGKKTGKNLEKCLYNIAYRLSRTIENFMILQYIEQDDLLRDTILVHAFRPFKNKKPLTRYIQGAQTKLANIEEKSAWHFYLEYHLNKLHYADLACHFNEEAIALIDALEALKTFYTIEYQVFAQELQNRALLIRQENAPLLDKYLEVLQPPDLSLEINTDTEIVLRLNALYYDALYGKSSPGKVILKLYLKAFSKGLLTQYQRLESQHCINLLNLSQQYNDFHVQTWIQPFFMLIPEAEQLQVQLFYETLQHYHKQEYKKALKTLEQVQYIHFAYALSCYLLEIKIHYQLEIQNEATNWEGAYQKYYKYLKRNKQLSKTIILSNKNFLFIMRLFLRYNKGKATKEQIQEFWTSILQQPIIGREWLQAEWKRLCS